MLSSLTISNFALIKKQTIEFKSGFNCLLGQSGAGKSIVIDALNFALGAKADKMQIRSGENFMRVDAVFTEVGHDVEAFLDEQEIDFDGELILSRTISVDGKGSIKCNGFPITAKMLQSIAEKLADFCGQHESVGLLQTANHLFFLDKFGGERIENAKNAVAEAFDKLMDIKKKIAEIGGDETQRQNQIDLLQHQIEEIDNAHLQLGEEDELRERYQFISSAEKIFEHLGQAVAKLSGGLSAGGQSAGDAASLLYSAKSDLGNLGDFKDIDACRERLENCYYEVRDVAETLEDIKRKTEFDPIELERIDERLDKIKTLTRKYGANSAGNNIEAILDYQAAAQARLEALENGTYQLEKLETARVAAEKELASLAGELSHLRKIAAADFEKKIEAELADLQMFGTHFQVDFQQTECSRRGIDNVKFLFSANVGSEVRDLHKTASGGELSRVLLAFKNVMLGREQVGSVIFDEIDAGISGLTAGKVAEKLASISKFVQVICITHTPVVASKANEFLLVEKKVENNQTVSTVTSLQKDEAVREIARLIDGAQDISESALAHAKNLLG